MRRYLRKQFKTKLNIAVKELYPLNGNKKNSLHLANKLTQRQVYKVT